MKKSVISYLYHVSPVRGEAYDPAPFSFRVHEIDSAIDSDRIRAKIVEDRSPIPSECGVDFYL